MIDRDILKPYPDWDDWQNKHGIYCGYTVMGITIATPQSDVIQRIAELDDLKEELMDCVWMLKNQADLDDSDILPYDDSLRDYIPDLIICYDDAVFHVEEEIRGIDDEIKDYLPLVDNLPLHLIHYWVWKINHQGDKLIDL